MLQCAHALLTLQNDVGRKRFHTPRNSAFSRGIRKNVNVGKSDFSCKVHAVFKLLFRFARKTDDDVRRDCRIGIILPYELHSVVVFIASIVTIHSFEHAVVTALQGQVKMRTKSLDKFRRVKKFFRNHVHFERAEPHGKIVLREHFHKLTERRTVIFAVCGQVDARHDNFFCDVLHFVELSFNAFERARATSASHVRDKTIAAKVVATVLNFDKMPRAKIYDAVVVLENRAYIEFFGNDFVKLLFFALVFFHDFSCKTEFSVTSRYVLNVVFANCEKLF